MNLGLRERQILVELQGRSGLLQVTSPGMSRAASNSRIRAARLLEDKGLVRVERAMSTTRSARRVVLWAHLTQFGAQFAEIYFVQLRTGGRVWAKKFERETGQKLPIAPHQERYPEWLINHHKSAPGAPRQQP